MEEDDEDEDEKDEGVAAAAAEEKREEEVSRSVVAQENVPRIVVFCGEHIWSVYRKTSIQRGRRVM